MSPLCPSALPSYPLFLDLSPSPFLNRNPFSSSVGVSSPVWVRSSLEKILAKFTSISLYVPQLLIFATQSTNTATRLNWHIQATQIHYFFVKLKMKEEKKIELQYMSNLFRFFFKISFKPYHCNRFAFALQNFLQMHVLQTLTGNQTLALTDLIQPNIFYDSKLST